YASSNLPAFPFHSEQWLRGLILRAYSSGSVLDFHQLPVHQRKLNYVSSVHYFQEIRCVTDWASLLYSQSSGCLLCLPLLPARNRIRRSRKQHSSAARRPMRPGSATRPSPPTPKPFKPTPATSMLCALAPAITAPPAIPRKRWPISTSS